MALARPFLSTERFTTVMSTRSASCVRVMPRASRSSSRCTPMPCSESAATSDGAFEVGAEAHAGSEHFGEDEGAESADKDAAGDGDVNAGARQVSAAGELTGAPRREKCRERYAGEDD